MWTILVIISVVLAVLYVLPIVVGLTVAYILLTIDNMKGKR